MCPPDVAFGGRGRLQHSGNCSGEGVVMKFRGIRYLRITSAHLIRVDAELALSFRTTLLTSYIAQRSR